MTHPAITAAITAARDFAEALEKTQAAFATSAAPLIVGQEIDADTVYGLPLGSEFTDRDGDRYAIAEKGVVWANDDYDRGTETLVNVADYVPLILTKLPEPADLELATKPEPYTPTVGDRVKILGLSIFDADYIGQLGTVVNANYGPGQVIVTPDGDALARRIYKVADLEPYTAPVPTRVEIRTADDRDRLVAAEPGIHGEGSAFIAVSAIGDRCAAWLSRDEARQLAATLTAIADS